MVNKAEQDKATVEIQLPHGDFPRTMYFNRFRLDRDSGFCLAQFGLMVASDLVDSYTCTFSDEMLMRNRDVLIEYLSRIGLPSKKETTPWKGLMTSRQTDIVDLITMAHGDTAAETCLYAFSMSAASQLKKRMSGDKEVKAQRIAMLRCSPDLQRQLIAAMYDEQ